MDNYLTYMVKTMLEKIKKRSIIELVVAGSAVFISLCALIVSYKQVSLMDRQMHLSVTPRLSIGSSNSLKDGYFNIGIINNGIGPAEILDMEIKIDSTPVANWNEFFEQLYPTNNVIKNRTLSKVNDRLMAAKDYFSFIEINDSNWTSIYMKNKHRISMRICYKSLFNDYYEVERQSMAVDGNVINRTVDENSIEPGRRFSVY